MMVDYPGHWMMSGTRTEEYDHRSWSVVRKPDGTYWQVASMDFLPRSGGTLKVESGDKIVDARALAYCEQRVCAMVEEVIGRKGRDDETTF